jgi:hypothetical protein
MADKEKYAEHIIHGSVPADEWEKFIKKHFVPGKPAASAHEYRSPTMGSICGSLGCPSTYHGLPLHSCSIDTENDGSTTIHCRYGQPASARQ